MEVFEVSTRSLKRQCSSEPPPRSRMGILLAIAGSAFLGCFALIVFSFLQGHKDLSEQLEFLQSSSKETLLGRQCESEFCTAKSCVTTASRLLDIMDNTTDPCQDFYQYACGGYKKKRNVRYNEDYYSPVKETLDNILVNIKRLMEKSSAQNESQALKKTKEMYALCMNTNQRNELNKISFGTWMDQIRIHVDEGLPPEGDVQLGNYGSWRLILAKLEEYQIHAVLKPDFKMSETGSLDRIEVDCAVPMLSPDTYLHPSEEEHAYNLMIYEEVIGSVFKILGTDTERSKEYVDGIVQLETEIARAIRRSPRPDIPSLSVEHKQQLKEIWRPLFGEMEFGVEVKSTCQHNLENILSVLNDAPSETSARYVIWRMMSQLMQHMGEDFTDLHLHYLSRLPGSEYVFMSPWKQCADMVRRELGAVVAKGLFDEGYFTEQQLEGVKEMFWELKTGFSHVLRSIPFLDDVTAGIFFDKLKSLKINVGFPEDVYSSAALDSLYDDFKVNNSNTYFLNILHLRHFKTQHFYRKLKASSNREEEEEHGISLQHNPLGQTSSYDYVTNTVTFDLGLLRPPLYNFDHDYPKFLKYSQSLSLAHELSHGFDDLGNFFDAYGNRWADLDWWPDIVKQKFNNFTRCLIVQHRTLTQTATVSVPNITDMQTMNNIISDLGAFFTTYAGLSIYLQTQGYDEKPLPGVSLTKKQSYFIHAAQTLCELRDKPSLETHAKYTMPPNIRVNGAVMNTEDFGSVFSCPVGSPMNPEHKCNLLH